ncbi:RNA-directed DNA polymerase from transposon X-element [Salix suchowensis]|nr:RNA-directed DNA polymerase from transposon X-element [Salix suchowensis]
MRAIATASKTPKVKEGLQAIAMIIELLDKRETVQMMKVVAADRARKGLEMGMVMDHVKEMVEEIRQGIAGVAHQMKEGVRDREQAGVTYADATKRDRDKGIEEDQYSLAKLSERELVEKGNLAIEAIEATGEKPEVGELRMLEHDLGMSKGSIKEVAYIKPTHRCTLGQRYAHLKLKLNDQTQANKAIRDGYLYLEDDITNCKQTWSYVALWNGHHLKECPDPEKKWCHICKKIRSTDVVEVDINCRPAGWIRVVNIYNDCKHDQSLKAVDDFLSDERRTRNEATQDQMIWAGDFNQHHPAWDEERNHHLFTPRNMAAAERLIDLTDRFGMVRVWKNFRVADWPAFREALEAGLKTLGQPARLAMVVEFERQQRALEWVIEQVVDDDRIIPKQNQANHEIHESYCVACNKLAEDIKAAKREHWREFLEGTDNNSVFIASRIVSGPGTDGGALRMLTLRYTIRGREVRVMNNAEKTQTFYKLFYPRR